MRLMPQRHRGWVRAVHNVTALKAASLEEYAAELSRRVRCLFMDSDGGKWIVSELDFFGRRLWLQARPKANATRNGGQATGECSVRVFDVELGAGEKLEFVLDDESSLCMWRCGNTGELKLAARRKPA